MKKVQVFKDFYSMANKKNLTPIFFWMLWIGRLGPRIVTMGTIKHLISLYMGYKHLKTEKLIEISEKKLLLKPRFIAACRTKT